MMNGIDISGWQNGINLKAVPADFVICKATEGTGFVSKDYARQMKQAKEAGKLLGVYHYADGGDAVAEAKHFINTVKDYIGEAILCLDWEGQNNKVFNTSGDRAWVKQWCEYVTEHTGVKPLIYTSASVRSRVQGLGDYALWIAQYANNKPTGYQEHPWNEGAYECAIRQYSSAGRLDGYNGNLDLDIAYMDKDAWMKYAGASKKNKDDDKKPANPTGSTLELAARVMSGEFGNGEDRKASLGKRYNEVQNFIDHIYEASVQTLVNEVLSGKYGNGDTRKKVLGSRYSEVQGKINGQSAKKSNAEIAKEIFNGTCSDSRWSTWGSGDTRKSRLKAAGYDPSKVQAEVNKLF